MSLTELNNENKKTLLNIAKKSIKFGILNQRALPVKLNEFDVQLQQDAASFVTLTLNNNLRGCIGTLEAHQALIKDVSDHAYAAAFEDPRFPKLSEQELTEIEVSISILTPAVAIHFSSEKDLLSQLEPGLDGVILEAGFKRATFLPAVWEQLKSPEEFLNHLKIKAGLNANDWPDQIKISRYQTISFK